MARQSKRLISLGYYDEDKPKVSYKENLQRVFNKKRRPLFGSPKHDGGPAPAYNHCLGDECEVEPLKHLDRSIESISGICKAENKPDTNETDLGRKDLPHENDDNLPNPNKFFIRCVSLFLIIMLSVAASLNGGSLIQMKHLNHWWAAYTGDFESVKMVQAELKQLQQEMIQLRSKLLPIGLSMPNFALESQGARVIHAHPSQHYHPPSQPPQMMFLGLSFFNSLYSPRTVIQGHTEALVPGRCWSFAGQQGRLFISLSEPVTVSHVTVGHISRDHAPTGFLYSAPQRLSVSGFLSVVGKGTHLGTFEYNPEGEIFQTFELPGPRQTYRCVMLEILSNWGHPEYTCVYSFKVHGKTVQNTT